MPYILDKTGNSPANKVTFNAPSVTRKMGLPPFIELEEFFYDKDIEVRLSVAGKSRTLVHGKDFLLYGLVAGLRATNGARIASGMLITTPFSSKETLQITAQVVGGVNTPPNDLDELFFKNPTSRGIPAVVNEDGSALTFADLDAIVKTKAIILGISDPLWVIERQLIEQGRLVETVQTPATDTSTQQPTIPTTTVPSGGETPTAGTGKPVTGWTLADLSSAAQAEIAKGVAAIPATQKGAAGGVAPLNAQGYVPIANMDPRVLIDFLGEVASQSAMLALTGQVGDWCIRTDINPGVGARFDLVASPSSVLANWKQAPDRSDGVAVTAPANISASRDLASTDANRTYVASAANISITVPTGIQIGDGVYIKPHTGTTTIAPGAGVKINGGTAAIVLTLSSDVQYARLVRTPVANEYDLLVVGRQAGAAAATPSAGVQIPTFNTAADTTGRTLASSDLNSKLIRYNSSANGSLTIPSDATLGITDAGQNAQFAVYQMGTGRMDVVADTANGVTLRRYTGYPTPAQYTTEFYHRVGPNTWALI